MVHLWRKFLTTEISTYKKLMTRYCSSESYPNDKGGKKDRKKKMISNGRQNKEKKDQKLLSITGAAREKVVQKMMASTKDKPTMLFINNPGDVDFVNSFVPDHVQKVVCSLPRQSSKMIFKDSKKKLKDMVSCVPLPIEDSVTSMVESGDVAVKILTKVDERSMCLNYSLLNNLALHNDTMFAENDLECYTAIPLVYAEGLWAFVQKSWLFIFSSATQWISLKVHMCTLYQPKELMEDLHKGIYPPFFKFSEELKLKVTDFDPQFTFTASRTQRKDIDYMTKADTIVLLKMEPRFEILNYLPNKEERYQCIKFFHLKRNTNKSYRLATFLNDVFPECLRSLCDHGYYLNTVTKDINTAELFYIFLIIKETPGFEDSALYSQLSMKSTDELVESMEGEKPFAKSYLE